MTPLVIGEDLELTGKIMDMLAEDIDNELNNSPCEPVNGFVLMVFPLNTKDGKCNFISNVQREMILQLMKKQISDYELGDFPHARH